MTGIAQGTRNAQTHAAASLEATSRMNSHDGYAESTSSFSSAAALGEETGTSAPQHPGPPSLSRRTGESSDSARSAEGGVVVSLPSDSDSPERRAGRGGTVARSDVGDADRVTKVSDQSSDTSSREEGVDSHRRADHAAKFGHRGRGLAAGPRSVRGGEAVEWQAAPGPGAWTAHGHAHAAGAKVGAPSASSKGVMTASTSAQQHQQPPSPRQSMPLRKGKWTIEEEMYTSAIIREFERGMLDCAPGTTLRSYLSEKLHCDPMRITKKFAGDASIGKRVFTPSKHTADTAVEMSRVRAELNEMARRFMSHLQRSNFSSYGSSGSMSKARRGSASNIHLAAAAPGPTLQGKASLQQQPHKYAGNSLSAPPGLPTSSHHHHLNSTLAGGGPLSNLAPGAYAHHQQLVPAPGVYHRRGEDGLKGTAALDMRGFDAPVVVDHTGALVGQRRGCLDDGAPSPARRSRSVDYDHDPQTGLPIGFARSATALGAPPGASNAGSYTPAALSDDDYALVRGANSAYGGRPTTKRYRKSASTTNYRQLTESLQCGLGHEMPPHYPAPQQQQEQKLRETPSPMLSPQSPSHIDSAKEEDSKLLLDFFVKVHERCGDGDTQQLRELQQEQEASMASVRKRTRGSLQQEQQQSSQHHAIA